MGSLVRDEEQTLSTLLALGDAGVEFYLRASRVAANPRARLLFKRLAEGKEGQVEFLKKQLQSLVGAKAHGKAAGAKAAPVVYPLSTIEPLVCFVCGEEVRGTALPQECPTCGASGYAFEVDINLAHARRLALESEQRNLEYIAQASRDVSRSDVRRLLRRLSEMEAGFVSQLERETPGP